MVDEEEKTAQEELEEELAGLVEEKVDDMINVDFHFEEQTVAVIGNIKDRYEDEFVREPESSYDRLVFESDEEKKEILRETIDYLRGERDKLSDKGGKLMDRINELLDEVDEVTKKEVVELPEREVPIRPDEEIEEVTKGIDVKEVEPSGEEFIERMTEKGNRVLTNPYDHAVIEIIGLREEKPMIKTIIDRWDLGGEYKASPQAPSFKDRYPEVSKDLVSWQFYLKAVEDLKSSGYDIQSILSDLSDEKVLATKSPMAKVSIHF